MLHALKKLHNCIINEYVHPFWKYPAGILVGGNATNV
jgi:hypothetical protein